MNIHEICEDIQTYDGTYYNVCHKQVGKWWYCMLVESMQDDAYVLAAGRGRTKEKSEVMAALDYNRSNNQ